jgi:hypothetical protein
LEAKHPHALGPMTVLTARYPAQEQTFVSTTKSTVDVFEKHSNIIKRL